MRSFTSAFRGQPSTAQTLSRNGGPIWLHLTSIRKHEAPSFLFAVRYKASINNWEPANQETKPAKKKKQKQMKQPTQKKQTNRRSTLKQRLHWRNPSPLRLNQSEDRQFRMARSRAMMGEGNRRRCKRSQEPRHDWNQTKLSPEKEMVSDFKTDGNYGERTQTQEERRRWGKRFKKLTDSIKM